MTKSRRCVSDCISQIHHITRVNLYALNSHVLFSDVREMLTLFFNKLTLNPWLVITFGKIIDSRLG